VATRGARSIRADSRPGTLRRDGSPGVQPGQTAARLHRARNRVIGSALVVCPLISGLFFGVISGVLVLPGSGVEHATMVGALVGGVMLTSNAVALCIVQSSGRERAAPHVQPAVEHIGDAKAS
jgi:hypothetical protein